MLKKTDIQQTKKFANIVGMELKDNILVSGNADSTVKIWDIITGQCLQTLSGTSKPVQTICDPILRAGGKKHWAYHSYHHHTIIMIFHFFQGLPERKIMKTKPYTSACQSNQLINKLRNQ